MKEYKEVVKKTIKTVVANTKCDKCDKEIEVENHSDVFRCEFVLEEGCFYPGGSCIERNNVDLCKSCGKKLMKYLEGSGYNINSIDPDDLHTRITHTNQEG